VLKNKPLIFYSCANVGVLATCLLLYRSGLTATVVIASTLVSAVLVNTTVWFALKMSVRMESGPQEKRRKTQFWLGIALMCMGAAQAVHGFWGGVIDPPALFFGLVTLAAGTMAMVRSRS
jgi:hypothetical protein